MASTSRKMSHKMKSGITDKREQKLLRVHRRSLDQREMRQEELNKRRQIDDMSPVVESQEASKNPSTAATPVVVTATQAAALSRLERLKKWKEERELKRKLEAMEKAKSKPGFKVVHIDHKDLHIYQTKPSAKQTAKRKPAAAKPVPATTTKATKPRAVTALPPPPAKRKPAAAKPVPATTTKATKPRAVTALPPPPAAKTAPAKSSTKATTRAATTTTKRKTTVAEPAKKADVAPVTRTTRSRGAATAARAASPTPQQKKVKQSPPKRGARQRFMEPTAPSKSRTTATTRKEAAAAAAPERKRPVRGAATAVATKAAGKVTTQRGEPKGAGAGASAPKPSFAPSDFVFAAPNSVTSFVFKPLSPNSAASFLFPKEDADSTTMAVFTNSVGRVSTPKPVSQPRSSSKEDSSDRMKSSSEDKEPSGRPGRRSCSQRRREGSTPAEGSPAQVGQRLASERSGSVFDSGIEVNTAGTGSDSKMLVQTSSVDSVSSAQKGLVNPDEKCSPGKGRNVSESGESVPKAVDVEVFEAEKQMAVGETEEPDTSSRSSSRKGKRKSKHVTIQENITMDTEDSNGEAPAAKQRRRSRRSVKSESVVESENIQDSVEEAPASTQPSLPEKITEEKETPSRSRRSRRSTTARSKQIESEEKSDEQEQKPSSTKKSTRWILPSAGNNEQPKLADTEDISVGENTEKADAHSPQKTRRSRCSVAKKQEEVTENKDDILGEKKLELGSMTETAAEGTQMETELSAALRTPENRGHNLCGRHAKDDMFLTPGLPISSQKRSTAKRKRRTATMIALSSAKSPEEAIKIISTSPMVEMTRRTPKSKISPGSSSNSDAEKERDVTPFRQRLSEEIEKLTQLSEQWTAIREATEGLSEEVEGEIRTTVCQAQLLMDRKGKFHQFASLVDKCQEGDPATTPQDLQGFWDMIFIQAEDIYMKFGQLERLQKNNWQPEQTAVQTTQPVKKTKKAASGVKKQEKKPVGKSKFAAFRAAMLKQQKAQEDGTATGDGAMPEEKVFDAGFFKVNSPVITPRVHCEAGTPSNGKGTTVSDVAVSTPTTTKTAFSSKDANPAATTTTTTETPKKAENKENVAQAFLRRSMGTNPLRRSYLPVVPSPLLKDAAPPASPSAPPLSPSKTLNTPSKTSEEGEAKEEMETASAATPVRSRKSLAGRRSTRGRKSVSFAVKSAGGSEVGEGQEEKEGGVDLMAYLQPSNSQSNSPVMQESGLNESPFSMEDVLKHCKSDTPVSVSVSASSDVHQFPGRQRKNSLKTLPSAERRRSRRSVTFAASTNTAEEAFTLPSTPYNRNSLVPKKRVTQRSTASSSHPEEQSPLSELQEVSTQPQLRRSARPSLLYTPPNVDTSKPRLPANDVPVAQLISLSPMDE
ncbi:uncharacterized protein LOC143280156 [Babylonia areolata]|uniref:uncharacterized protein LOC143280156 n=1 Tax=Babylonia areolata TaxID=304850 RepID=UPI003FD5E7E6